MSSKLYPFTLSNALCIDEPAPVIKANSEYPEWVFQLGIKVRIAVRELTGIFF